MRAPVRWGVRIAALGVAAALVWPAANKLVAAEQPMPLPSATWSADPAHVTPRAHAPGVAALTGTSPLTVYIPELGVELPFHDAGQTDGWLDIGTSITSGVHFADGSTFAKGSYLVAAHVNSKDLSLSPFAKLWQVQQGTLVWVTDEKNVAHEYVTDALAAYDKQALPTDLFRADGNPELVLVTCGGKLVGEGGERHYEDNVVVRATPRAQAAAGRRG